MKVRIYSDLHLEFASFDPSPADADIVILAGDIHTKARGVEWANDVFDCPVLYVCGNHEFYRGHLELTLIKMKGSARSHVHVLNNEAFVFNQTRFLCATAWTDFSLMGDVFAAKKAALEYMNDYAVIRTANNFRRLRPDDLVSESTTTYAWLSAELEKPFDGKTVVITHHAPTPSGLCEKLGMHLEAAYANDWPELVSLADVWVYGHTHAAADFIENGCRLISNPRGYPNEQTGFRADLVVEI
ncbi:putative phosphodiesterase [Pseudomonas frederiksbergensis]|jgi:predicted phosphodiesterase|uniref:metallophosphoesterase family protein n=1 Tax=Pseudomonas frederiksbergensis TaxID=104087 RepID=UPI003D237190